MFELHKYLKVASEYAIMIIGYFLNLNNNLKGESFMKKIKDLIERKCFEICLLLMDGGIIFSIIQICTGRYVENIFAHILFNVLILPFIIYFVLEGIIGVIYDAKENKDHNEM